MFGKKKRDIIIDEKRKRGSGYEQVYPMEMNHREILRQETRPETIPFLIFSIGFSLLCGVLTFFLLRTPDGMALVILVIGVFGGMGLFSGVIAVQNESKLQLDLWEGIITSAQGRVWVHHGTGNQRGERISKLEVDGVYFPLPKTQLGNFVNGQRYRVYYAPYTKIVVDSEPI